MSDRLIIVGLLVAVSLFLVADALVRWHYRRLRQHRRYGRIEALAWAKQSKFQIAPTTQKKENA